MQDLVDLVVDLDLMMLVILDMVIEKLELQLLPHHKEIMVGKVKNLLDLEAVLHGVPAAVEALVVLVLMDLTRVVLVVLDRQVVLLDHQLLMLVEVEEEHILLELEALVDLVVEEMADHL